jgi:hypothetical protein
MSVSAMTCGLQVMALSCNTELRRPEADVPRARVTSLPEIVTAAPLAHPGRIDRARLR